jgi:hypothetical protein
MQHVHDELISLVVRWVTKRSKEEKMRTFWVQGKLTWWALDVCVWNVGEKFGVFVDDVFIPGKFLLVVWAPRFSRANGSCTSPSKPQYYPLSLTKHFKLLTSN